MLMGMLSVAAAPQSIKPLPEGRMERRFHHALERGDTHLMARIIRKKLRQFSRSTKARKSNYRSETATNQLLAWLRKQPLLSSIETDSCGSHIAIWPGWSDYVLVADKSLFYQHYQLSVQHGAGKRRMGFLNMIHHRPVLLAFRKDSGALLESFRKSCVVEADNRRRSNNDQKFRLSVDPGQLNYTSLDVDAPGFLHSEKNVLRVKFRLENASLDTLWLRWPVHQNYGYKMLRVQLIDPYWKPMYRESEELRVRITDRMRGPDTLMLLPGEMREYWHSVNDILQSHDDVRASHLLPGLKSGKYKVRFVYTPFERGENPGKFWKPSLDSTDTYLPYSWIVQVPETVDTFWVSGKVVAGSGEYESTYGISGAYMSLIRVEESSDPKRLAPGDTIAWKLIQHGPVAEMAMPLDWSPYRKIGTNLRLVIDGNLARELWQRPIEGIPVFSPYQGLASVRIESR
jgi:hypothetical protein